jgi:hypothetical protein
MEKFLLDNVPTVWLGVGMIVVAVAIALGGYAIVRRMVEHTKLVSQHDVAGFLIAVMGVIYAVLLAFVVVIQWQQYSDASNDANAEANAIGNLYRDAVALGPAGQQLRVAVYNYAHEIAYVEWPYMATHQDEYPGTDTNQNAVWKAVVMLRASNPTAAEFVRQAVSDVSTASNDRRTRVRDSSSELPTPLWVVLLAGGVLTVGFCYFFSLDSFVSQAAMLAILSTLIALSLFVILTLDLPFTGGVAVAPSALTGEMNEFCSYNFVHPKQGENCNLRHP